MISSASGAPRIPRPPETVSALRQAVARVAPAALAAFANELDEAADLARQGSDMSPLRRFTAQWAVFVEIQRNPEAASRFRELEEMAGNGDASQARRAAAELGRMLDDARAALSASDG